MNFRLRYSRTDIPDVVISNRLVGKDTVYSIRLYKKLSEAELWEHRSLQSIVILEMAAKNQAALKRLIKFELSMRGVTFLDETRISAKQRGLMKDGSKGGT